MASKDDQSAERNKIIRFAGVGQGHFAQSAVLPAFDTADNCELVAHRERSVAQSLAAQRFRRAGV